MLRLRTFLTALLAAALMLVPVALFAAQPETSGAAEHAVGLLSELGVIALLNNLLTQFFKTGVGWLNKLPDIAIQVFSVLEAEALVFLKELLPWFEFPDTFAGFLETGFEGLLVGLAGMGFYAIFKKLGWQDEAVN